MTDAITDWSDEYDNAGHIPDAQGFIERWPARAEAYRETVSVETNIPYDTNERNHYDLFTRKGASKGFSSSFTVDTGYDLTSHSGARLPEALLLRAMRLPCLPTRFALRQRSRR